MNNTLFNGFRVLEYLAGVADDCSVTDLAGHFGLPNSHVHRLLRTLTETGYVEQTPKRKYRVSLRILHLAHARLAKIGWRAAARPYLQQAARDLDQPVYLTANDRGFSLIIATEFPESFAGDAGLAVGQLHAVNRSACGKVCAAYATEEEWPALLAACDWRPLTPTSVTTEEAFRAELAEIRTRGYARMNAEFAPDTGAVAAPVFGADKSLAGAVGATLPRDPHLWTEHLWERYAARMRRCAESISFTLGGWEKE